MTPRDEARTPPPPPCGAGAGGGGRADAPAPKGLSAKLGHGWSPDPNEITRQKDRARTKLRAQRLRKDLTSAEKELQKLLRTIEGAHFRKQVAVDDYVFDFGWYSARVLIELDGSIHRLPEVQLNDKAKTIRAIANGFRLLRFENDDVWARPAWVLAQVREALNTGASDRPPPLTPPRKGAGDE
ncbi:MAG: endonuclease domain-containing protein [Hyphomonadaceae bacterium]